MCTILKHVQCPLILKACPFNIVLLLNNEKKSRPGTNIHSDCHARQTLLSNLGLSLSTSICGHEESEMEQAILWLTAALLYHLRSSHHLVILENLCHHRLLHNDSTLLISFQRNNSSLTSFKHCLKQCSVQNVLHILQIQSTKCRMCLDCGNIHVCWRDTGLFRLDKH